MANTGDQRALRPFDRATYLIYVDDSGDETESFHTGILIPMQQWSTYLGRWLNYRKRLYTKHQVPTRWELHSSNWLMGKDRPVPDHPDNPINKVKGLRHEWSLTALRTIAGMPDARVITRRTHTAVKADAYGDFLDVTDKALSDDDAWGIVVMDGDPVNPDPHLTAAHRQLPIKGRRLLEDAWVQASSSQLIQMTDLVAHCAFQAYNRDPSRKFMWDWYCRYLHAMERQCECPSPDCSCLN